MASVVKYIVVLAMFIQVTQSGPVSYGVCVAGCYSALGACVAAVGGVTGPAGVVACNTIFGCCVAGCSPAAVVPVI